MNPYRNQVLNALLRQELGSARARRSFMRSPHTSTRPSPQASAVLAECAAAGIKLLTMGDTQFPKQLAAIPDPPLLLFVKGNMDALNGDSLAVVGGREASGAGRRFAARIAECLSSAGLIVVSGLALGIDTAAHQGALGGGSPTIAVLGSGHGRLYPSRNAGLAEDICARGGAVISEYPPHWSPKPYRFPERNRIVSGLALGVLVIEARARSGSLITANYALEQGREVLAVPGPVESHLSRGAHALIREGAALVESAEDVFAALGLTVTQEAPAGAQIQLAATEQQVLNAIDHCETSLDTIVGRTGLEAQQILQTVLALELAGFVESEARGYIRAATR